MNKNSAVSLLTLLLVAPAIQAASPIITGSEKIVTVAGGGTQDRDGIPATNAALVYVEAVVLDTRGNLYLTEAENPARVRKVDSSGTITTWARTETGGYLEAVGIDSVATNLFVSDRVNNKIFRIDAVGKITTVAGTGIAGKAAEGELATSARLDEPFGVAVHPTTREIYFTETANNRVCRIEAGTSRLRIVAGTGNADHSGDGGPAANAKLHGPCDLAFDSSGHLFIVDRDNHCIRRVDALSKIITTVAGTPKQLGYSGDDGDAKKAELNAPEGIAIDGAGNILVSDLWNHAVRKIDVSLNPWRITTVAGTPKQPGSSGDNGPAKQAKLERPGGMAFDQAGNLYIADCQNHRVRKVIAGSSGAVGETLTINTSSPLPAGTVGTDYTCALLAAGGRSPYRWERAAGALPSGLQLDSTTGLLTGKPQTANDYVFTVKVTDAGGLTAQQEYRLTISPALTPGTGPTFTVGTAAGGKGAEVTVPVTVKNFKTLGAFQFSMHWKTAVATYIAVEQFQLQGLAAGSFGSTQAGSGTLTVAWNDTEGTAGETLADGAAVFAIRFRLVGNSGDRTDVTIDGTPTPIVAGNAQLAAVNPTVIKGQVEVRSTASLSGKVLYYDRKSAVRDVTLSLAGDAQQTVPSGPDGTYSFNVNAGGNYTVTPSRSTDPSFKTGTTTSDILPILLHVQNRTLLDSPYQLLAADVDGSRSVNVLDAYRIQRFVLNPTSITFTGGWWRFVSSDYPITENNAWTAEAIRSCQRLSGATTGQDFLAIKLGDVNRDWKPSATTPANRLDLDRDVALHAPAAVPKVTFQVSSPTVKSGEMIKVAVGLAGFSQVTTVQFTLRSDPAILEYVTTGDYALEGLGAGNFGTDSIKSGMLTFSWYDPNAVGVTKPDGTVVFTVSFRAIGRPGGGTALALTDDLAVREVTVNLKPADFISQNGQVTIASSAAGVPSITQQPQVQTAPTGTSVTLSVTASGTEPLQYQWWKDNAPVPGATSATLVLTAVQVKDAGRYSVKVTNNLGSATSETAQLTVTGGAPELLLDLYAGLTISGVAGRTYTIQFTTDLTEPAQWRTLATITLLKSTELWFDVNSPAQPRRFYRAVLAP